MKSRDNIQPCHYTPKHGWRPVKQGIELLSERELEVFKLLAIGLSSREIGKKLFLAHQTVGIYKARILDKLPLATNMGNNADLIHYALYHGIVKNNYEPKEGAKLLQLQPEISRRRQAVV